MESISKGYFVKFLAIYLRETENNLLRRFLQFFQRKLEVLSPDFWEVLNDDLRELGEDFKETGLYILQNNYKLKEQEAFLKIERVLINVFVEFGENIKTIIKETVERPIISKIKEKLDLLVIKDEQGFLERYEEILKEMEFLIGLFHESRLKLYWAGGDLHNKYGRIMFFEDENQFIEKKLIIFKEISLKKDTILNKIVKFVVFLFLSNSKYFRKQILNCLKIDGLLFLH